MKAALLFPALLSSTAALADDGADYKWKTNADAIVAAIHDGVDLSQTGLANLLYEDELGALGGLAGCSASSYEDVTKNFAATDWICGPDVAGAASANLQRRVTMRFGDDGSLFEIAINPLKANYAPTEAGLERTDWPAQEVSAKAFAKAVSEGGDASLGGTVPLTDLQVTQLARLADSRWRVMEYMNEAEKRQARKRFGPNVKFAEQPENGVEMIFSSNRDQGPKDKMVTIYFDDEDRPAGLHIKDSLLAVERNPR